MIVVDLKGKQRTAVVGRVKIEKRPLILVEAKVCILHSYIVLCALDLKLFHLLQLSGEEDETSYSIILQNAETVALVTPHQGFLSLRFFIAVCYLFYIKWLSDECVLLLSCSKIIWEYCCSCDLAETWG